jgi:CO/xanthine dehydrogenase FAD-binding subunit
VSTSAYFLPSSLDEATSLLAEHGPTLLIMAGGTIAMPLINEGISLPEKVMGLRRTGMNYISRSDGYLAIGATTTFTEMIQQSEIPMLQEAARAVGGWAIRNMGTVGGNLFAPPPAGDFAVALLALDAQIKLVRQREERWVPLADFYSGFMATALQPSELVAEVRAHLPKGKTSYVKFGRRHANTPSVVSVAAQVVIDDKHVQDVRLALNAVSISYAYEQSRANPPGIYPR